MAQKRRILFADNDEFFLKNRQPFLEQENFEVLTATNPEEAQEKLRKERVDLAILDVRMRNDNDEKDLSGFSVAKHMPPGIPKIMLTGFPTVDGVREALKPILQSSPLAVDFVTKAEGPDALLHAVLAALCK